MSEKNIVIEFFEQGKSFVSEEGINLIVHEADKKTIRDACDENPDLKNALGQAINNTKDVFFRRKILLVFSE